MYSYLFSSFQKRKFPTIFLRISFFGKKIGQKLIRLYSDHSDLKCQITFGNGFWVLNGGNRSIVLNFYQKKLVFALKNYPRPQRPKRPIQAKKRPAKSITSKVFDIINIHCIIINKCEFITKKRCFNKIGNFHFYYINFLKSHFVEYVKFAKSC